MIYDLKHSIILYDMNEEEMNDKLIIIHKYINKYKPEILENKKFKYEWEFLTSYFENERRHVL